MPTSQLEAPFQRETDLVPLFRLTKGAFEVLKEREI